MTIVATSVAVETMFIIVDAENGLIIEYKSPVH